MKHVVILCNALDDETRLARGITTDSPAASRKIFMAMAAIRAAGVAATVVSLGRGRRTGTEHFRAFARRANGVPTVYLPFATRRLWSEFVSLAAGAAIVFRLAARRRRVVLVVYNRAAAYVPAMLAARLCGMPVVLDLEDGSPDAGHGVRSAAKALADRLFDRLCSRALLACSALGAATALRPSLVYYGIASPVAAAPRFGGETVTALLGGTVDRDTGAETFADAVDALRRDAPGWAAALAIEVTGKGASIGRLAALAAERRMPVVTVHGRLDDTDYARVAAKVDVGLALKPNHGPLAHTTFPSKVVEMAAAGQLVLTTDISDVRAVLGDDGAVYLTDDTPATIVDRLRWIVTNPDAARAIAARGSAAVARACDARTAGVRLAHFLFAGPA